MGVIIKDGILGFLKGLDLISCRRIKKIPTSLRHSGFGRQRTWDVLDGSIAEYLQLILSAYTSLPS